MSKNELGSNPLSATEPESLEPPCHIHNIEPIKSTPFAQLTSLRVQLSDVRVQTMYSASIVHLCVPCDSLNKQILFPYATSKDWFFNGRSQFFAM